MLKRQEVQDLSSWPHTVLSSPLLLGLFFSLFQCQAVAVWSKTKMGLRSLALPRTRFTTVGEISSLLGLSLFIFINQKINLVLDASGLRSKWKLA